MKIGTKYFTMNFLNLQDLSLHTLTQRTQRFKSSKWYDIVVAFMFISEQIRLDQSLSGVRLFGTPWIAARQASLSITNSQSSLKFTSIESVMTSSHLILSSPSPPAPNPSQQQSLFQWVNSSHQVAKVLEFQLQHQSFQWIFRTDFL